VIKLTKWIDRGLEETKFSCLEVVNWAKLDDTYVVWTLDFIGAVFEHLPVDNQSCTLLNTLVKLIERKVGLDKKKQEVFDVALGHLNLTYNFHAKVREWLFPKRLEIHQTFESIPNEKKRFVKMGLKLAVLLFSQFKASNQS